MATIQEINSTIMFGGGFTNEQLDSIICAVKYARGQLVKANKRAMTLGTKVKFTNSRTGQLILGDVIAVKHKYIHVRVGTSTWRVPCNMLTMQEV